MPEPQPITKIIDHIPHTWVREPDPDGVVRRGGHWQSIVPPETPEQQHANTELMKQTLTLTGGILGGGGAAALLPEAATAIGASRFLPAATRILGSAFGGSLGRMAGHTPEALVERTTGRPSGTTYGREAVIGGTEGALNEALPMALEPVTSTAGTVLKFLGKAGLDPVNASYRARAYYAMMRGIAARGMGLGGVGDAVASVGPIVASEAGRGLENLAPRLGTGTLSERVGGGLDALRERIWPTPPLSHAERLAAGAEEALARKTAPWRVPEPYPKPERTSGDPHVNPWGFVGDAPPDPTRGAEDILGQRYRGIGTVGRDAPPYQNPKGVLGVMDPGDANWQDWVRGGRARGAAPTIRVNPEGTPSWPTSPENPLAREPDVPVPAVAVTPRGFTGKPEDVIPPVTAGRSGFAFEPLPPDVAPTVTAGREGFVAGHPGPGRAPDVDLTEPTTGREPFVGAPPPREGVTVNPHGSVMSTTEQPPWLDQYAIDPGEYRSPSPAGSADALVNRVRRTPQGFDVDLTGPNIIGGPEAPAKPSVTPASDLPANLTADQLVDYYAPAAHARPSPAPATPPPNAVEALANKINPMEPGELWGRRLFRGDLDNELVRASDVNVPAEHFDAAMAYAKKRLGIE